MRKQADWVLLEHAAPTLAGIKTASMFRLKGLQAEREAALCAWREVISARGISVAVLQEETESALVYVYRASYLRQDWEHPGVAEFLAAYGYDAAAPVAENLDRLRIRLAESNFPHEIGLFLGYPLADVQGFIAHCGRNYRLCGCWKVYGDPCFAQRCFAKYKKCRDVYLKCYEQGQLLSRLTVVR